MASGPLSTDPEQGTERSRYGRTASGGTRPDSAGGGTSVPSLLSGKRPKIEAPDADQARIMLSACVGERVDESCGEMFSQEFRRRLDPSHDAADTHPKLSEGFRVLVIGAGVSGIIAAEGLSRLGIPYLLVDRHSGPGGNWRDNNYPGAGVDTPSHLYTFSFSPNDWSYHFELRSRLEEYFESTFDALGARANARFDTDVVRAEYLEEEGSWKVELRGQRRSLRIRNVQCRHQRCRDP